MRTGRTTASDVARLAGVSKSTVSYVLNDTPGQSFPDATRQKVRRAAQDLGYAPSAAARALRNGRSDAVLVMLPDVAIGESLAQVVESLSDALEQHGYGAIFRRQREERTLVALARELMPAAVVTLAPVPAGARELLESAGIPLIATSGDQADVPSGTRLQNAVGHAQAQHLLDRGHRHLAFAAPDDARLRRLSDGRLAGVRAACALHDAPAPIVDVVDLEIGAAAAAIAGWRGRAEPVTGVCAYNDEVALAILAGMRTCGLRAPRDLAVAGVDDLTVSRFSDPPLTTVDFHPGHLATDLARVLLQRLGFGPTIDPLEPGDLVELVQREST